MCGICFAIKFIPPGITTLENLSLIDSVSFSSNASNGVDNIREEEGKAEGTGLEKEEKKDLDSDKTWNTIVEAVKPRGPDYHGSLLKSVVVEEQDQVQYEMKFHASILHMRGEELTKQPFVSDKGDILLWNGEIFDGLEILSNENDGQKLFNLLLTAGSTHFFSAIRSIEGPYAFVYFQSATQRVYFARDPLGRRSLLLHNPTTVSPYFYLSSNAPAINFSLNEWKEVECNAVHCIDLKLIKGEEMKLDMSSCITSSIRYPKSEAPNKDSLIYPFDRLLTTLPNPSDLLPLDYDSQPTISTPLFDSTLSTFLSLLEASVLSRIATIPLFPPPPHARIAILFSGGIDCTLLAMMVDKVLEKGERIDLINVSFENPRKIRGNLTAKFDAGKKKKNKNFQGVEGKGKDGKWKRKAKGKEVEGEGEGEIVEKEVTKDKEEEETTGIDPPPPPPISNPSIYDGPDRITGRDTLAELKELRPERDWNFIEVDITYQEMLEGRDKVIELLRPHDTIMDLSIAIAFFFAAKGAGHISNPTLDPLLPRIPYQSNARVLFSGLGADELLGGYARHRRAFDRSPEGDWVSLIFELQMDLDRIHVRNLGRDDRIISFHGKEARYPFLAGKFVDFVCRLPVWLKVDPRGKEGLGDKLLLRRAAASLGLGNASVLKKRAIHFGAGTAKMELDSGKAKGDQKF